MGTAATPTKTAGVVCGPLGGEAQFTLVLDTTDANGLMTVDLTDYFGYLHDVKIGGELAATANGYVIKVFKPALATALTATNLSLGFYEAGADGDELDPVGSTDLSTAITGLTLSVVGKPAIDSSWA